jgi:hypothetical protein
MKGAPHFAPWEVLPDVDEDITWDTLPAGHQGLMKQETLDLAEEIREIIGPFTVNNYHRGGKRKFCGFRDARCPHYSPTSKHSTGDAIDGHPIRQDAEASRALIRKAVAEGKLKTLGGIELGVSWLHFDRRPRRNGKVVEFHA